MHWLRAGFDAIGVGGHTARLDDPSLTVRGPVTPRVPPRRIVFDKAGDLDLESTLVRHGPGASRPCVVTGPGVTPGAAAVLEAAGVSVLRAESLSAALAALRSQGVSSLLLEGGGRLAGALLAAGVVDRFYWIQAPIWLGDGGVPAVRGLPDLPLADVRPWSVVERRTLDKDTLLVLDRN